MPQVFDRYRLDGSDLRRVGGPASHLVRDLIESLPVDPDALHVAEHDVEREPKRGYRVSLTDLCPFQVMAPSTRSMLVGGECGYHAHLSAVQARLADHARDGRAR